MDRRELSPGRSAGAALAARLLPFAIIFFAIQFGVRFTLSLRVRSEAADAVVGFLAPFLIGAWFDLVVFSIFAAPMAIWWLLVPQSRKGGRLDRYATLAGATLFLVLCLIAAAGEHLFWTEFGTRFNFIAVDYLIYTREVVQNIWQSYPIGKLVLALLAFSGAGIFLARHRLLPKADGAPLSARWAPSSASSRRPIARSPPAGHSFSW